MTRALFHALCCSLREHKAKHGDLYYICTQDDVKVEEITEGRILGKWIVLTPETIRLANGKVLTHKNFTSLKDIQLFCYVERCELIRGK